MVRFKSNVMCQCLAHSKPLKNIYWSGFSFFITCIRKGGRHESELMRELGLVPGNFPTQSSSTILRFGYVSTSQSFMWLIFINIYRRNLEYCFWFHISWKNHWLEFRLLLFTQSCPILWDPMDWSMPGFPVLHHLLELLNSCSLSQWCHLSISSSIAPFSCLQYFPASALALYIMWPNYWSFSFSISPSNEHSGLISFMIDWFDLSAVQGTLKSLL